MNSTGCKFRIEFNSGCLFWPFAAFTAQLRRTSLAVAVYAVLPMSTVVVASAWLTVSLVVPSTRRTTLGDRAFFVAASRAWNDLPPTITASPSLLTFRQQLKTYLFCTTFYWPKELNCVKRHCNVLKCCVTEISAYLVFLPVALCWWA